MYQYSPLQMNKKFIIAYHGTRQLSVPNKTLPFQKKIYSELLTENKKLKRF